MYVVTGGTWRGKIGLASARKKNNCTQQPVTFSNVEYIKYKGILVINNYYKNIINIKKGKFISIFI